MFQKITLLVNKTECGGRWIKVSSSQGYQSSPLLGEEEYGWKGRGGSLTLQPTVKEWEKLDLIKLWFSELWIVS